MELYRQGTPNPRVLCDFSVLGNLLLEFYLSEKLKGSRLATLRI
ncbi:hypothetical protein VPHK449_0002 [Vibrio phage K449]